MLGLEDLKAQIPERPHLRSRIESTNAGGVSVLRCTRDEYKREGKAWRERHVK